MGDSTVHSRPTTLDIDLLALENNFQKLRDHVAPSALMTVVKANAYGHGLIECSRHLEKIGANYFGVALVEEGVELRRAGIKSPILVFGGIVGGQIDIYLKYDLDITASSIDKLKAIDEAAKKVGRRARVHLKIDTGMRRIGVRPSSAQKLIDFALATKNSDLIGVFSHFANADHKEFTETEEQLQEFLSCTDNLKTTYPKVIRHIANSAAVLSSKTTHLDMVRIGISLYGIYPAPHLASVVTLKSVMSLSSQVVFFKVVTKGQGVSYGHTWHAPKDSRIVTVPIGYGDGYPRSLSNKAEVLIKGKRYPVVGTICMDQMMVNIGDDTAYNGDPVTLIGKEGSEEITVSELAERAGTIPYEILTSLNLRLPRRYKI